MKDEMYIKSMMDKIDETTMDEMYIKSMMDK